jgi:hypothetical protein
LAFGTVFGHSTNSHFARVTFDGLAFDATIKEAEKPGVQALQNPAVAAQLKLDTSTFVSFASFCSNPLLSFCD